MRPFEPVYIGFGLAFALEGTIWMILTLCVWKFSTNNLQKYLIVLPWVKSIFLLQITLNYYTCPWDQEDIVTYISMFFSQIMSILTVICANTFINCLFYIMAKGWQTTLFNVERKLVTNMMMVGGAIYLLELASNYQNGSGGAMGTFLNLVTGGLYSALLIINLRDSSKQIKRLRRLINDRDDNLPQSFIPSWKLKLQ